MSALLLSPNGNVVADSTAVLSVVLYDIENVTLDKAAILSLTLTLVGPDGAIINNRDDQDIYDVNGGIVAADGSIELSLQPADNPFVSDFGATEDHDLALEWTWSNGTETRTGSKLWRYVVEKSLTGTPGTGGDIPWVG